MIRDNGDSDDWNLTKWNTANEDPDYWNSDNWDPDNWDQEKKTLEQLWFGKLALKPFH